MSKVADPIDFFLLPLDPARGLRTYADDLGRYAELDPRVREATALVEDRLNGLSDEERTSLGAILWTQLRPYVQSPEALGQLRRSGVDGAFLLPAVDEALAGMLSADVLKTVVQEGNDLSAADAAMGDRLRRAADELTNAGKDKPPAALVVGVVVAIVVIAVLPIVIVAGAGD